MAGRMIETSLKEEDIRVEGSLRPGQLDDYIGQSKIKENLKIYIEAAKKRQDPLDHVLFYGPPGLGKTTLAGIIANEMQVNMKVTSGPAIEKPGEMAAILNNLKEGDVLFVDEIHRLNKIYRQKDRATDVLSFPLGQDGHYDTNKETGCALLGDVVISLAMAVKQADMYGHSLEREIGFLTVHSMLHLLGYDHETSPLEERKMREKEEEVLGELGISREATFTNQPEDTDA